MLANMTHEAFPRVMDYFAVGDGFYLVMELIRGKDLSELLEEQNAPFETQQVLEWADQILDALEDLHSQDIVHRDIKPSNLKLTPRGRIKLLDFGIAKGAAGDMAALQSTVGSMAAATLQYAPLEQVLRADTNWFQMLCVNFSDKTLSILDHGTDSRSDLYALAATLYHLLTNTLPVNAPTRALSIWTGQADKLHPAHEINQKVSRSVSAVLQKALEIDRENRLRSANEMRKMLGNGHYDKDEETVVIADEKTLPLPIQSAFPNPKPDAVETEILDDQIPVHFHEAVDKQEQETVARVLPSDANSKKRKIITRAVIGIFAAAVIILLGFLFLIFGPTGPAMNKGGGTGNTSTSPIDLVNIPAANKSESAGITSTNQTGSSGSADSVRINSLGMELVYIPPGEFMMGSTDAEVDEALFECKKYYSECKRESFTPEMPKHKVTIREGFWMGKYEMTQGQWQAVIGENLSNFKDCGANCPVERVSWNDVQSFLKRLNAKNDGFEYSLPSEAQWEYSARAGTTGDYYGDLDSIAWYGKNSGSKTHPVGGKKANAFGLYDMSGNVWEWCQDWYGDYSSGEATDPTGTGSGQYRVLRGGSWGGGANGTRSAYRLYNVPSDRNIALGFRVAARPK